MKGSPSGRQPARTGGSFATPSCKHASISADLSKHFQIITCISCYLSQNKLGPKHAHGKIPARVPYTLLRAKWKGSVDYEASTLP